MEADTNRVPRTKILVVDDERHIVRLLEFVLTREGYDVATAYNGEQAIAAVDAFAPDAVFLDLFLPGISGLDVLEQLRERNANVAVIVLTSRSFEDMPVDVIAAGARAHCTKPIAPSTVLRTLVKCGLSPLKQQASESPSPVREEAACHRS